MVEERHGNVCVKKMTKKLLIVESPAKAKTIKKYLGNDFKVMPSVGHVRDLPKKGGLAIKIEPVKGIEGEWTFTPKYEISPDKKKVVSDLRAEAKAADEIYLAPDPDREGEAIAWHLSEVLSKVTKGKKVARVTYNQITRSAVQNAIANPREIDLARVDAQQARRILDRLVGFQVSPMLWKYLSYGRFLSAGRVQSVALRLLVEREREIRAFVPMPYWVIGVEAKKDGVAFNARLVRIDGKKSDIHDDDVAADAMKDLVGATLRVSSVKDQPKSRHPYPPFTTSTLQQAASSVCGFSPHRTMGIAQKLYERGLITYMRTDSVNVAPEARSAAAEFVTSEYGSDFLPERPNFYKSKSGAQEAHEAIRPTDVRLKPGAAADLDSASAKLYDLIWRRFVASQMADARLSLKTVTIEPVKGGIAHSYEFSASATSVVFEGFLKAMPTAIVRKRKEDADDDGDEVDTLPPLTEGDAPEVVKWLSDRKETKPPSRYSEAALVKALEENGVGRPSTYAQTIEVQVNRQYATRESRHLVPTKKGEDVNDWLVSRLPALFDVGYTAEMEAELDRVEDGAVTGEKMLSAFYAKFLAWLAAAKEPPPDKERFITLFALLDEVREWRPERTVGKKTYDERAFIASVREQMEQEPEKLSVKQLTALAGLAASYRDQIADADGRLAALGWGELVEKVKSAPSDELVRDCFTALDAAGGIEGNWFIESLRKQFDMGRSLSPKQFAILARTVAENCGEDGFAALRERLAQYLPSGAEPAKADPALPELMAMLDEVKTWHEPVKRGKRTFDDKDFADSLKTQFARRKSLTPRQVAALKKMLRQYGNQIADFDERAKRLGFPEPKGGAKRRNGGAARR